MKIVPNDMKFVPISDMKIVPISEIDKIYFALNDITCIRQCPNYHILKMEYRKCNGFVLIENGECYFTWKKGKACLKPGSMIYLPFASNHEFKITSEEISFYRVNFTITDIQDQKKWSLQKAHGL